MLQRGAFLSCALDGLLLFALVASLLVFILYPLLRIVESSLFLNGAWSTDGYEKLLSGSGRLLWNSLFVAVLSAVFSTCLGLAVALFQSFCARKTQKLWRAVLLMTMVSPPFIASLAYIQLFGRRGLISYRLLGLSLNPYGWHGIVMMQSLYFAAQSALLFLGVLRGLDVRVLQASADLGARPGYTLFHVILPTLRPAILVCALLSFIRSLADFGTPTVIGGGFDVLASEIYLQIIGYGDLHLAAAMNMLLLAPTAAVFWLYRWIMRRNRELFASDRGRANSGGGAFHLRGVSGVAVGLLAGIFFGMMLLQYGSILLGGFTKSRKGALSFTLEHFGSLFAYNAGTLLRSTVYALIVAVAGTLVGILLSYYVERRRVRLGGALDFLSTLPYMLPGTCFGIGYILAFNHPPLKLTGTAAIVVLNMLFRQLPVTTKAASAALVQLPRNLEQAGQDLGASRFRTLWEIILPNLKGAFSVGFINNFSASMTTVGSVIFLVHPRAKIAVFTLFDAINSGEYGVASLISACIILITLAVIGVFSKCFYRREGERRVSGITTFDPVFW